MIIDACKTSGDKITANSITSVKPIQDVIGGFRRAEFVSQEYQDKGSIGGEYSSLEDYTPESNILTFNNDYGVKSKYKLTWGGNKTGLSFDITDNGKSTCISFNVIETDVKEISVTFTVIDIKDNIATCIFKEVSQGINKMQFTEFDNYKNVDFIHVKEISMVISSEIESADMAFNGIMTI